MDLAPTLLDLAGVEPPANRYNGREVERIRGSSMTPYLLGQTGQVHLQDQATGWELFGRRGIRQGSWKALFIPLPEGPEVWQLYNLANDPGETTDLAAAHPAKLTELLKRWEEYVEQTGVLLQPPPTLTTG
jgi:arylsulfatase A-like enzyme